ncbi:CopD family protein [Aquisalimonas sp.]|uniref:CopD family protein n=1 Tax=Aquisalimonas sp. TaxID=1872621 RepID=UPI0025B88687|nr:CopD family protein [Aquisalimonas sp.]
MLWVLILHVIALLFWSAALLYLPALVAGADARQIEIADTPTRHATVARVVCTHVATPAALLTITSGTAIFLLNATVEVWLIAKLTLVAGLVVCHVLMGVLILRAEGESHRPVRPWCWLLGVVLCVLMTAIVWVVLAKPSLEALPWAP